MLFVYTHFTSLFFIHLFHIIKRHFYISINFLIIQIVFRLQSLWHKSFLFGLLKGKTIIGPTWYQFIGSFNGGAFLKRWFFYHYGCPNTNFIFILIISSSTALLKSHQSFLFHWKSFKSLFLFLIFLIFILSRQLILFFYHFFCLF
jgi:hypothetical protein